VTAHFCRIDGAVPGPGSGRDLARCPLAIVSGALRRRWYASRDWKDLRLILISIVHLLQWQAVLSVPYLPRHHFVLLLFHALPVLWLRQYQMSCLIRIRQFHPSGIAAGEVVSTWFYSGLATRPKGRQSFSYDDCGQRHAHWTQPKQCGSAQDDCSLPGNPTLRLQPAIAGA
jgi:hypothetical protein